MKTYIGIDFGTTKTLVSRFDERRGEPRTIRLGRGRDFIPTSIYAGENGTFLYGEDADDQSIVSSTAYARAFKLGLGSSEYRLVCRNGQAWKKMTAQDLTRAFLEYVRNECIAQSYDCRCAVITRPVNFSPTQIAQLEEAARTAGIEEVELITEPQAAGYAYCMERPEEEWQNALVVDWGGGTLDMALVSKHGDEVDAHDRYRDGMSCGGEDFDDALLHFVKVSLEQGGFGEQVVKNFQAPEWLYKTRKQVRRAKETLSRTDSFQLRLSPPYTAPIPISRKDFEGGIMSYIDKAAQMAKNLIASIREQTLKPSTILLVGGSSRIPAVARVLERETGLPCRTWDQNEEAVSLGAATVAFKKWGDVEQPKTATRQTDRDVNESGENLTNFRSSDVAASRPTDTVNEAWLSYLNEIDIEIDQRFHNMLRDIDREIKESKHLSETAAKSSAMFDDTVDQLFSELIVLAGNKQIELINKLPEHDVEIVQMFVVVVEKLHSCKENKFELALAEKAEQLISDAECKIRKKMKYSINWNKFGGGWLGWGALAVFRIFLFRTSIWIRVMIAGGCVIFLFLVGSLFCIESKEVDVNPSEREESDNRVKKELLSYIIRDIDCYKKRIMEVYAFAFQGYVGMDKDGNEKQYDLVERYHKLAVRGIANAQYRLGICYSLGWGIEQNYACATKWYRKAAEQGHAAAQFNLGCCYNTGQGVTEDVAEAVIWFREAAKQGFAMAQYNLGYLYENGQGVAQSSTEAAKWYRKVAEQGFAVAQNHLGVCYQNGQGVNQDYAEAVKWFRRAAEQGHADAQFNLGCCYNTGQGVAEDVTEAARWFCKAAEQGIAMAQYNLGYFYENGQGVAQSSTEAAKWFRKAAKQRLAVAQNHLGVCCQNGQGVIQDYAEAVKWFCKAAEQGYAAAQFNLGCCYNTGQGVVQSSTEAFKWYRKAAEQGYAAAQNKLGYCYDTGQGLEAVKWYRRREEWCRRGEEAVKWYRKAAEQGLKEAQFNLGCCYESGLAVARDDTEAVKWYRKAAEQGYAAAQNKLGCCYDTGQGVEQDAKEAVKWYRKAAEQEHAMAQFNLGCCYEIGQVVAQDDTEAVKWYRKAAEQGLKEAQERLRQKETKA